MPDSLVSLESALPISAMIFLAVLLVIFLTRVVLTFILNLLYSNYQKLKNSDKLKYLGGKKKFTKEDEELIRKKYNIPRSNSALKAEARAKAAKQQSGSYEVMASEEQEQDRKEMSQMNIVDIVKPIGFWTSMILGQKLTYLINSAQIINKKSHKGFWVSMVEAKDRAAGRQHGRTR